VEDELEPVLAGAIINFLNLVLSSAPRARKGGMMKEEDASKDDKTKSKKASIGGKWWRHTHGCAGRKVDTMLKCFVCSTFFPRWMDPSERTRDIDSRTMGLVTSLQRQLTRVRALVGRVFCEALVSEVEEEERDRTNRSPSRAQVLTLRR